MHESESANTRRFNALGAVLQAGVFGLATFPLGCFDAVDVESAYEDEDNLCEASQSAAYQQRIEACRERWSADSGCAGVISFMGTLESVPVTVDADLEQTSVRNVVVDGTLAYRNQLKFTGRSPYFLFEVTVNDIGGQLEEPAPRTLTFGAPGDAGPFADGFVDFEWDLTAGTKSDLQFSTGSLELDLQTPDEHAGRFQGETALGTSQISGCFHAFTTDTRFEGVN